MVRRADLGPGRDPVRAGVPGGMRGCPTCDIASQKADVVLEFKTLQDYVNLDRPAVTANGGPYFGETIGRYGNRIAKGTAMTGPTSAAPPAPATPAS
jgi:hypothetical protein